MTIRDFQNSFTDTSAAVTMSVVGAAGTYLAPNTIDMSPLGAYLTEQSAADTTLSANVNAYRELGGGERIWLVVDWIVAPLTNTACQSQLITSAASGLGTPTVMIDFTAVAIATLVKGYRQIAALPRSTSWLQYLGFQVVTTGSSATAGQCMAFLTKDVDAVQFGAASGFSIK